MDLVSLMADSVEDRKATVEMVQPCPVSSHVFFILCDGVLEAVVKRREYAQKAVREECHYQLAEVLGAGSVAAPCIAIELSLVQAKNDGLEGLQSEEFEANHDDFPEDNDFQMFANQVKAGSVCSLVSQKLVEALTAQEGACCNSAWITVEKSIRVSPVGPASGLSQRLGNLYGCADMMSAYCATPDGRAMGYVAALRDQSMPPMTDADFYDLVAGFDVASVHRLCVLACVALQRDGASPNLMVQEIQQRRARSTSSFKRPRRPATRCSSSNLLEQDCEQPEEEKQAETRCSKDSVGRYALVTIDATRILGSCPISKLYLTDESDDPAYLAYWYPLCLSLPQAAEPFHKGVAAELLTIKPCEVWTCVSGVLGSTLGASFGQCSADAELAAERFRQLQSMLQGDILPSPRKCCFDIVDCWRRDWEEAVASGEFGPIPEFEEMLHRRCDSAVWERLCLYKKLRRHTIWALGILSAATAVTTAVRLSRHRWR
jgi:hypothetical protein